MKVIEASFTQTVVITEPEPRLPEEEIEKIRQWFAERWEKIFLDAMLGRQRDV